MLCFFTQRKRSGTQLGFTLIEIMVVVIIIGILSAMVVPKVVNHIAKAQETKARSDLGTLESAIEFYKMDNFAYPRDEWGVDALIVRPSDPSIRNWRSGGYLKRLPKDPWGNDYQYRFPGENAEFDVFTFGRDGRAGGEGEDADIGNWMLQ